MTGSEIEAGKVPYKLTKYNEEHQIIAIDCALGEGEKHIISLEASGYEHHEIHTWYFKLKHECQKLPKECRDWDVKESIKAFGGYTCADIIRPLYGIGIPVLESPKHSTLNKLNWYIQKLSQVATDFKTQYEATGKNPLGYMYVPNA